MKQTKGKQVSYLLLKLLSSLQKYSILLAEVNISLEKF